MLVPPGPRREAEFFGDHGPGGRGAESVDPEDGIAPPGERLPAGGDARFGGHHGQPWRQDRLAGPGVLLGEEFPGRHGDHPRTDAAFTQLPGCLGGQGHLGAGGDQGHGRFETARLGHDPGARGHTRHGPGVGSGEDRQPLTGQDQRGGPGGALQGGPPRRRGLVGVGRADDHQVGDGAQAGDVLHRLMGRAVLPTQMESWVKTKTTGNPMSAASRMGGRM
jgi:hypothetical protein